MATDFNLNDLPLWVKIVGSLLTLATITWAVLWAVIDPWADARFMRRIMRCSDPIEKHMREKMFSDDYKRVAVRDEKIATLDRKADANQDSITALTQIARSQGTALEKAMSEIPTLSGVIGKLDVTLRGIETTMNRFEDRVDKVVDGHNHLSGIIEAWRDKPAARPRSRKRTS